jgi:hypothetical protein
MTTATSADTAPLAEKPKLYRDQLPDLFWRNGLPRLSVNYLNKISSLGYGPPYSLIWNRRPLYDPDEAIRWLRTRVEEQTQAALARAESNLRFRQERLAKLARDATAVRAQRDSSAAQAA